MIIAILMTILMVAAIMPLRCLQQTLHIRQWQAVTGVGMLCPVGTAALVSQVKVCDHRPAWLPCVPLRPQLVMTQPGSHGSVPGSALDS